MVLLQRHAVPCGATGQQSDIIASWPRRDVLQAPLWMRGDRCGSVAVNYSLCSQASNVDAPAASRNIAFLSIHVDQRTPHGPHRCALSLKRAAVARSSVAHTTLGWHCCSPERRGPAGTQVTRAVEEWSQDGLSLLVCAAGHLWSPAAARRIVHAPTVRRPSPSKAREAAQG